MARTIAILLAGGSGTRLSSDIPKQFTKIAGQTVLEHTFHQFEAHPGVDAIAIVVPAQSKTADHAKLLDRLAQTSRKPVTIVPGGTTRNQSTANALQAIGNDVAHVLIHDAARPLVTGEIISRCIDGLSAYQAIDTVIECADTIVQVDEAMEIAAIPDRRALRRGQTPQAFHLDVLRSAYRAATEAGDLANTDDCGVVLRYRPDIPIGCVDGSPSNIKITHPVDLVTADRLFQLRSCGTLPNGGHEIVSMARHRRARVHGFSLTDGGIDIRSEASVIGAIQSVVRQEGRIDAVINAAGVLGRGRLADLSLQDIRSDLETNLIGAFIVAKSSHVFLQETRGHLVFFTSSSYTRGRATYAAYSAAKAGVVNMAQALADEWHDVKVNCINPERTATRMRARAFPDENPDTLLSAFEVASATLSLLDSNVTGQVIDIRKDVILASAPRIEAVAG